MTTAARKLILSATLAVGFLSAGAFAPYEASPVQVSQNVTIIMKQINPAS